jgi:hypothetical protein
MPSSAVTTTVRTRRSMTARRVATTRRRSRRTIPSTATTTRAASRRTTAPAYGAVTRSRRAATPRASVRRRSSAARARATSTPGRGTLWACRRRTGGGSWARPGIHPRSRTGTGSSTSTTTRDAGRIVPGGSPVAWTVKACCTSDGDLHLNSNFSYKGFIYVEGDIEVNGNAWILGGIVGEGQDQDQDQRWHDRALLRGHDHAAAHQVRQPVRDAVLARAVALVKDVSPAPAPSTRGGRRVVGRLGRGVSCSVASVRDVRPEPGAAPPCGTASRRRCSAASA